MNKKTTLDLAPNLKIPAVDYAGQGNGILGIRNSGKTHTAMKAAEELMDAGIPIIAYDPVGVWKHLKTGVNGHKGYDIVVAGGDDTFDIVLTPQNATRIVQMAMEEGISLVIDLYSTALINKATWIKIVQETVDLLMYNNKSYSLRHIFLEEAAEFIPQRLQPQHSKVYASIERLARMGRNAKLGYTIINQRAEEINKAILEICEFVLLHKQVGKNSLASIKKWMDALQVDNAPEILKSLSGLQPGECWAVGLNTKRPHKVKISPKKTFHPDPKSTGHAITVHHKKPSGNVAAFIEKLRQELQPPAIAPKNGAYSKTNGDETLRAQYNEVILENKRLEEEVRLVNVENAQLKSKNVSLFSKTVEFIKSVNILYGQDTTAVDSIPDPMAGSEFEKSSLYQAIKERPMTHLEVVKEDIAHRPAAVKSKKAGIYRMLVAAAMYHPNSITKYRMAAIVGMSHSSGSFNTYLSSLKRDGNITGGANEFTITELGLQNVGEYEPIPTNPAALVDLWCGVIGENNGASRIFRYLAGIYPQSINKEALGEFVGMSAKSGSFNTYLSTLKRYNLITVASGVCKAADELFG